MSTTSGRQPTARVRRTRSRGIAILAGSALVVVACAGPSPSVVPSPSTSRTPLPFGSPGASQIAGDPSAALLERLADPDLTARTELFSTIQANEFEILLAGTLDFAGTDEREAYRRTVEAAGIDQVIEAIQVGDEEWSRTEPGPWITSDPDDDDSLLHSLASIEELAFLGSELSGVQQVLHFEVPDAAPVDPADWGLEGPDISDAALEVAIDASPDGTPLKLVVDFTFTQAFEAVDVPFRGHNEVTFVEVGGDVTVEAPDEVWPTYTAEEIGLTIGHPPGTTVAINDGVAQVILDNTILYSAAGQPAAEGLTLESFRDSIVAAYAEELDVELIDVRATTIADVQAAILAFRGTETAEGASDLYLDAIVIVDGRAYEIFAFGNTTTEADDRGALDAILTTVSFGEE